MVFLMSRYPDVRRMSSSGYPVVNIQLPRLIPIIASHFPILVPQGGHRGRGGRDTGESADCLPPNQLSAPRHDRRPPSAETTG